MRHWRVSGLILLLGATATLFADTADPGVQFNKGGNQSVLIGGTGLGSSPQCDGSAKTCIVEIPDAIVNGGADFDVLNKSGKTVTSITFFIPTINFDQLFSAESNLFTNALIVLDPTDNLTDVTFFGTGSGIGEDSVDNTGGSCAPNCLPGFENGQNAPAMPPNITPPGFNFRLEASFNGTVNPGSQTGLQNNEEGNLDLVAVPEPGTFALLIGAVALLAGSRKLRSSRARI